MSRWGKNPWVDNRWTPDEYGIGSGGSGGGGGNGPGGRGNRGRRGRGGHKGKPPWANGNGNGPVEWNLIDSIDYSVDTGTQWIIATDDNGDNLSKYDKIYIVEIGADGGASSIEVQTAADAWLTTSSDYYDKQVHDSGSDTGATAFIRLTNTGSEGFLMMQNFGLAARCTGVGEKIFPGTNSISSSFEVRNSAVLKAFRVNSSSARSTGTLLVYGGVTNAEVIETGTITASTLEHEITGLSGYDEIRVRVTAASGVTVKVQLSNGSFITSGYDTQRLGSAIDTFNDNDSGLLFSGTDGCQGTIYNFGLSGAPTISRADEMVVGDACNWSIYPTAEAHQAIKIILSANTGGADYEITGTPVGNAEVVATRDFSSSSLGTTKETVASLDGYSNLRVILTGLSTGGATILAQYRVSGGAFITGGSYDRGIWTASDDADAANDTRAIFTRASLSKSLDFLLGFGIPSNVGETSMRTGGEADNYKALSLEDSNPSVMDAFQWYTSAGTMAQGNAWIVGEKKET